MSAWVALWQAYQAGDLAQSQAAQEHASQVADLVQPFRFPAIAKAVIGARLGIDCGDPRPPGQPLTDGERGELMGKIRELGLVN